MHVTGQQEGKHLLQEPDSLGSIPGTHVKK